MKFLPEREQHVPDGNQMIPDCRRAPTRGRRVPLFAVVALLVFATTACGGVEPGDAFAADTKAGQGAGVQESPPAPETTAAAEPTDDERGETGAQAGEASARAGDSVARGGAARAGEAEAGAGKAKARAGDAEADAGGAWIAGNSRGDAWGQTAEDADPRTVTLEMKGERGAAFSGACSVGGKERRLYGEVPGRFVFEPRGKRLECELRNEGGGALGIVLSDGAGVRSEQRTAGGESTVRLTYSNGSVTSSTSSVSEA